MNMEEKSQAAEAEIRDPETAQAADAAPHNDGATDAPEAESTDNHAAEADESGDKVATPETDWQDKYLRLYAEFDNFRKRSMRERSDLIRNASKDVVERMLPILDDFERAMKAEGDLEAVREGSRLIHDKLMNTLSGQGLKPMTAQPGDAFDVELHEAITRIPAPDPSLVGKVVDVVEQGYYMNDTVLRYAKVVVGS
jgi:molecular chaperone GrpE